jgi:hypothetical protein
MTLRESHLAIYESALAKFRARQASPPREAADSVTAAAQAIVAAAARARSGGVPVAPPTGIAAQIIEAGRKRRGETSGGSK